MRIGNTEPPQTGRGHHERPALAVMRLTLLAGLWLMIAWLAPVETGNTIEDVEPEEGVIRSQGSAEATVLVSSESSCLVADSDPGIEVSFEPDCGGGGQWTAVMTVTHDGSDIEGNQVLISEVDEHGSEIDSRVWRFQVLTTIPGPSTPSSSTTSPTPPTTVAPTVTSPTSPASTSPPATIPPTTTPPSNPTTTVPSLDSIREQFMSAGIAFNTPASMELGETTTVQLLLGPDQAGEDLEGSISAPGAIESGQVRTTCRTTARLQGQDFEVLELTEATQFVCAGTAAQWRWDVTARRAGTHRLTLTMSAVIADNPPVTIEVFQRDIEIRVGFLARVWAPVAENFGIAFTALVTAIATATGTRVMARFRKGRARAGSSG